MGMVTDLVVDLVVAQKLIVLVAEAAHWGEHAFLQNNQTHVPVDLAVQREHLVEHLTKHLVLNQVSRNENSLDPRLAQGLTRKEIARYAFNISFPMHTSVRDFLTAIVYRVSVVLPKTQVLLRWHLLLLQKKKHPRKLVRQQKQ